MWKNILKYSRALLLILFFLAYSHIFALNDDVFSKVKIKLDSNFNYNNLIYYGFDLETARIDKGNCEIIVDAYEMNMLNKLKVNYKIITNDVYVDYVSKMEKWQRKNKSHNLMLLPDFQFGSMGGYYTLSETYEQFDNMRIKYPQYLVKTDTIGYTFENRPIVLYTYGDTVSKKNEILLTALHHAREPGSVFVIIYFLKDLLQRANAGVREALFLLKNRTIYVIAIVNPDGLAYNEKIRPNGGGMWRKNRFVINDSAIGIDLNRNYGPYEFWNAPINGSSVKPLHNTYRGTAPFSEKETQAIRSFALTKNIKLAINYHTYGNLLIFPFGALAKETSDSVVFRKIAEELSQTNRFVYGRDLQTVRYPARGVADDWFYWTGKDKEQKTYAFTAEVGTVGDGFWTTPDRIAEQCRENIYMNEQILWSADINWRPRNIDLSNNNDNVIKLYAVNTGVNNAVLKPRINLLSLEPNIIIGKIPANDTLNNNQYIANYKFSIVKDIPNGKSVNIQIETIQEGVSRLDTISMFFGKSNAIPLFQNEHLVGKWNNGKWGFEYNTNMEHFVLSDSPKGYYKDNDTNYIQMLEPIKLDYNAAYLRFVSYWEIETNYDYAVVELSTDAGVTWHKIDAKKMCKGSGAKSATIAFDEYGFSGSSLSWFENEISLNNYLHQEILLRFGVLSDKATVAQGWLLDSISIIVFPKISSSIDNNEHFANSIFPNPVKCNELINMELEAGSEIENIIITDIIGNILDIDFDNYNNTLHFAIAKRGVYFIKVFYKNGNSSYKKLIVL